MSRRAGADHDPGRGATARLRGRGRGAVPHAGCPALDAHVDALAAALHGPVGVRTGMLAEVRDGLVDATDALTGAGLAPGAAAERAVREFGPVEAVAPGLQAELVIAQSRRTALLLVLLFPLMLSGWDLLWIIPGKPLEPLSPVGSVLAGGMDVVTWTVAATAAATLALTWSRRVEPRLLARIGGALGLIGTAYCGGGGIALSFVGASQGPVSASWLLQPPALVAYATSGLLLWSIARSTVRSLRVTRTT